MRNFKQYTECLINYCLKRVQNKKHFAQKNAVNQQPAYPLSKGFVISNFCHFLNVSNKVFCSKICEKSVTNYYPNGQKSERR